MKATLISWHKARINGHYILELKIHQVAKSVQYPEGVKYGLICKDLKNGNFVLLDNHHPKGHHLHINKQQEVSYRYDGIEVLLDDFKNLVETHLGVKI